MKARSFNTQLLLILISVIAFCWTVVVAVVLTQFSLNKISTWDEKLAAIATQLLVTIPADSDFHGGRGPGLQLTTSANIDRDPLAFQVWLDRSKMVASTPDTPSSPLKPDFADGVASTIVAGQKWRSFSVSDSTGRVTVQVGNLQTVVDADMRYEAARAVILSTVLLLVAGAIMWLVVVRSLKPVKALGRAMRQRRNFDFTPLPAGALPRELQPLVDSFNHLLRQLEGAIEDERGFISDAAHELRTPLSALQAQAEIAMSAGSNEEKDTALRKLLTVAQRSTRLSEQLLDLARLNAATKAPVHVKAELSSLVQHVAQEFEIHARQNNRALYLNVRHCIIRCDIDEIGILLRNLVDNAMRYSATGGTVLLSCGYLPAKETGEDSGVFLEVSDDGPGVPISERDAIFVRFYRVASTPVRGSGIGLSLVAGIAQLHHAKIKTARGLDGKGLSVRIIFPLADTLAPAEME